MRKLRSKTTVSKHDGGIMFVQVQCPECARRDERIMELRIALSNVIHWFNSRSPGFRARCSIDTFQKAAKLVNKTVMDRHACR